MTIRYFGNRGGRFFGSAALLVFLSVALIGVPAVAATPSQPTTVLSSSLGHDLSVVTIDHVMISNVNDVKFTVSWTTSADTSGLVRWGTAPGTLTHMAHDPVSNTSTHYVTIEGLSPSTQYFFEVESDGVVGNNGGSPYAVTTGPTLLLPSPGAFVYGYAVVNTVPPAPLPNAIVFLRIEDNDGTGSPGVSQWIAVRTDSTGGWYYSLSGIRTSIGSAYFGFSAGSDNLYYWAEGGVYGQSGVTLLLEGVVPVPAGTTQLPDLVFAPLAVTIESFEAYQQGAGILIVWQTASEIDNQGFNLYRAIDPTNPQELLGFVPSRAPGGAQGYTYEWLDTNVASGETYYYWLESIDLSGTTTLHGPVSATYQVPTAVDVTGLAAQPIESAAPGLGILAVSVLLGGVAYGLRRRSRQIKTE